MPESPDSHLGLTSDRRFGTFDVLPFQIWRSEDLLDLRIFPSGMKPSELCREHLYLFHCDVSSDAPRALGSVASDCAQTPSTCVEMRIHYALLDGATANLRTFFEMSSMCVDDPIVGELAIALMTALPVRNSNPYTIACITKMLCARLNQARETKAATSACRFEDWQLSVLLEALAETTEEYISVADIALRCRLSVCHFSRLFRATFGMPLHRYRVSERIKQAKSRLADTSDPISQIALDCGFADQSSFTRRFTAIAGVPPAIWRRRVSQQSTRRSIYSTNANLASA